VPDANPILAPLAKTAGPNVASAPDMNRIPAHAPDMNHILVPAPEMGSNIAPVPDTNHTLAPAPEMGPNFAPLAKPVGPNVTSVSDVRLHPCPCT